MTLIDLGELTEPTDLAPPRRRGSSGSRRLWAALVALAALLAMAGAAPPAVRVHATVPAGLGSEMLLSADQIFTVAPVPGATDGTVELVAYPRPERATVTPQQPAPLWRLPLPPGVRVYRMKSVPDGGVLLSMALPERSDRLETMLLDTRTGQQRWRAPGFASLHGSGRALLRTFGDDEPMTLRSIEVASGRELWSASLARAPLNYQQWDSMTDAVVVLTIAGDVEVLDPRTGAVRHSLPAHEDAAGDPQVWLAGDLVLKMPDARTITAYSVDGLTQRWQTTMSSADHASRCGALICVGHSGGVYALDPETGAVRWSSTEEVDILLVGDRRAVANRRNLSDLVALDLTTGAVLTDYGPWDVASFDDQSPQLLGTRVVPEVGVVLARFDPAVPQPRRVDVLTGAIGGCRHQDGLIGCRRGDGTFGVWQLRG